LEVLAAVLEAGQMPASAIADRTAIPLSTVYRHLAELVEQELVVQHRGTYEAGPILQYSIAGVLSPEVLSTQSRSILADLTIATGETALGVIRFGLHVVVFAQEETSRTDRVSYFEGAVLPLHAGAAPRALLAFAPPTILNWLLSKGLKRVTIGTLDEAALAGSLAEIRRIGYSVSNQELTHGGVAVAVPVFVGGRAVAALAVQGPTRRCGPAWRDDARIALISAATELGHRLESLLTQPSHTHTEVAATN
jgi:IclR family KDG regulon transcriptional repressor